MSCTIATGRTGSLGKNEDVVCVSDLEEVVVFKARRDADIDVSAT